MFDYRMVMSIHDQKMQEYRAEAERDRMRRIARGRRPTASDQILGWVRWAFETLKIRSRRETTSNVRLA